MNQTIENFLVALSKVEEADFLTARVKLVEEEINIYNDTYSTYENNFVVKLNEKYALSIYTEKIDEPKDLIRQFQIPKKYAYSPIAESKITESVNKLSNIKDEDCDPITEFTLIPDFIIHKKQEDKTLSNQRLIAEVKTEFDLTYSKFAWDFLKLIIYLNKFHFQNAIFLSINNSLSTITSHLNKYIDNRMYMPENYRNLFIIIQEDFKSKPIVFSLQDFYDNKSRNSL